ncbi:MATE family efflux transporter [Malaciobacter molluscorum]|uniref:MATE family efflux transporter n=1 Tax=Malaciobacter molluscorum TaxID=1032072 RepID=UPI00100BFD25|nr:MATE family efflux transporter [Malaciobacter molluscorum]RXJ94658.1 MATE family efflux transporter [Malaciobacter molluscorum]
MLTSKPLNVFFKYAIPAVFGLVAISSASIIDGYFVGNYVGPVALASLNMSYPIVTIIIGFAFMFAAGSSVICAKLIGEKNVKEANNIFTKAIIFIVLSSILIVSILLVNLDNIFTLFHAENKLKELTIEYLSILLYFLPIVMTAIVLDYFVRVDERPNLAFFALFFSSVLNIILDYYLIAIKGYGISAAAYATGISQCFIFIILIIYFLLGKSNFSFIAPYGGINTIMKAIKNGSSEFVNEASSGITIIIFNYVMLKNFGTYGVTAFTVIGYFIMASLVVNFAVADSMQPVISKNYGALNFKRIEKILKIAVTFLILYGIILAFIILSYPNILIELFLEGENKKVIETLTLRFVFYIWPAFLFSGICILITSYFTALHRPMDSIIIAISRSLILPISLIMILPKLLGDIGIFITIPLSEFITFLIASFLFIRLKSDKSFVKLTHN